MGAENLVPPTGIRSLDRPARSESLYRLSYPAHDDDNDDNDDDDNNNNVLEGLGDRKSFWVFGTAGFELLFLLRLSVILLNPSMNIQRYT